ncbi:hypothetical protein ACJMK2_042318 [Sinanodonta woodiana]|uniref:RING-CH-type domain-containing protein n=1 Tax=Sinanodonta woodiana TaxID=1069815 RepID=A0ABD3W6R4_SINWO
MDAQKGKGVKERPFISSKDTVHHHDRKVFSTVLVINPSDSKAKLECRICQDDGLPESMVSPCRCSGSMAHVHKSCLKTWINVAFKETPNRPPNCEVCDTRFAMHQKRKLKLSRCPHLTPDEKLNHVILCVSIIIMLVSIIIVFVSIGRALNRSDHFTNSTEIDIDSILLQVFGVTFVVFLMVAFISQRNVSFTIYDVVRIFYRNSVEWTFTSNDKSGVSTAVGIV